MNASENKPKKHPFLLKALVISLVLISLAGWLRLYQSIYQWEWLIRFQVQPGPLYTAVSGALAGAAALTGALGLWLRKPWAVRYTQISVAVLMLGWWLDYLVFANAPTALTNLPFRLIMSAVYLVFVYLFLYLYPRRTEKRKDEPQSE